MTDEEGMFIHWSEADGVAGPESCGPEACSGACEVVEGAETLGGEADGNDNSDEGVEPPDVGIFLNDGRQKDARGKKSTGQRAGPVLLEALGSDAATDMDLGNSKNKKYDERRRIQRNEFDDVLVFVVKPNITDGV